MLPTCFNIVRDVFFLFQKDHHRIISIDDGQTIIFLPYMRRYQDTSALPETEIRKSTIIITACFTQI